MIDSKVTEFQKIYKKTIIKNKVILQNNKTILLNGDVLNKTYFEKESFDLILTSSL